VSASERKTPRPRGVKSGADSYLLDVTVTTGPTQSKNKIPILFCCKNSIYNSFELADVYDEKRNALNYNGNQKIIAHPPCRFWSKCHGLAKPRQHEYELGLWAIEMVQRNGGILEHPKYSKLFEYAEIEPTIEVHQQWWGHKMKKETWLYAVNVDLLPLPFDLVTQKTPRINQVSKKQAMATPYSFAEYLLLSVSQSGEKL